MHFPLYTGMRLPVGTITLRLQHKSRCHAAAGFGERDWHSTGLAPGLLACDLKCRETRQTTDWQLCGQSLAVLAAPAVFLTSRGALGAPEKWVKMTTKLYFYILNQMVRESCGVA